TTCSRSTTNTFPSPTFPVRPPSQSALTVASTNSSDTAISKRTFSARPTWTVVPRYVSTRSSSPPWPCTRLIENPRTSARYRASRTAFVCSGRTIPITSFMTQKPFRASGERLYPAVQTPRPGLIHARLELDQLKCAALRVQRLAVVLEHEAAQLG